MEGGEKRIFGTPVLRGVFFSLCFFGHRCRTWGVFRSFSAETRAYLEDALYMNI